LARLDFLNDFVGEVGDLTIVNFILTVTDQINVLLVGELDGFSTRVLGVRVQLFFDVRSAGVDL